MPEVKSIFREVLPKQGSYHSYVDSSSYKRLLVELDKTRELLRGQLSMEDVPTMVLCKPKLLPLKSVTLEKLEKMQMEAQEAVKQQELAMKGQLQ